MPNIEEFANRFDYSASKNYAMWFRKTKQREHTNVWVRVNASPYETIAANNYIVMSVFLTGTPINGGDATPWYKQSVRFKPNAADNDGWIDVPFVFTGWSTDEMILNGIIARRNDATDAGTLSNVPLLVRRVTVYTS